MTNMQENNQLYIGICYIPVVFHVGVTELWCQWRGFIFESVDPTTKEDLSQYPDRSAYP